MSARSRWEQLGHGDLRRALAIRLGAIFYVSGGLLTLAVEWIVPAGHGPTTAAAGVAVLTGVAVCFIPWERWDQRAMLALPYSGFLLIGLSGSMASHTHVYYVGFYGLTLAYIGLTQRPWTTVKSAPLAVAAFLLAAGADLRPGLLLNAIVVGSVGVVVAESLSVVVSRYIDTVHGVGDLLDATRRLTGSSSEWSAADVVVDAALQLLRSDCAFVLVGDPHRQGRFEVLAFRGADLGSIDASVDTATEQSGVGEALQRGERILVADARTSPLVSRRLVDHLGLTSVLYLPLPAKAGYVGVLVAGWRSSLDRLSALAETSVEVISTEAGAVLERLGATAQLVREAHTDPLTSLANRRSFDRSIAGAHPGDAVVMIDLDRFKAVNDTLGHEAGDELLRSMASCMRKAALGADILARWGGEEFVLLLPKAQQIGAEAVVERLRELWSETDPPTTFSAGIAVVGGGEPAGRALSRADAALYEAKRAGRDRVRLG
ncbi:MAG: hypothetical protein NVS3B21_27580 [Acidimicrobiales bacterium]